MRLVVLIIGVAAAAAAALTAVAIALVTTERGRAATATVAERFDPQVTQVRRAIDPGVQSATQALRRIPVVADRLPASIAIETPSPIDEGIAAATDALADATDTLTDAAADAADKVEAAAG